MVAFEMTCALEAPASSCSGYSLLEGAAREPAVAGSPDTMRRIRVVLNGIAVAARIVAHNRLGLLDEVLGHASANADQKPLKTFMLQSGEIEAIEVHHLGPGCHEVLDKLLLPVRACVDLG
jgi:hypothetical protein